MSTLIFNLGLTVLKANSLDTNKEGGSVLRKSRDIKKGRKEFRQRSQKVGGRFSLFLPFLCRLAWRQLAASFGQPDKKKDDHKQRNEGPTDGNELGSTRKEKSDLAQKAFVE